MTTKRFLTLFIIIISIIMISNNLAFAKGCSLSNNEIRSVISTNWLNCKIDHPNLCIIDIRSSEQYIEGHIKNSINIPFEVPFSQWITMKDDLLFEVPEKEVLFKTISNYGISKNSIIVLIASMPNENEPPYSLAMATRAACTLKYAGLNNISILDGGYSKWLSEGKAITTETYSKIPLTYKNDLDDNIFVSIDYVKEKINKSIIIDARDKEVYLGEIIEEYANKPGHIPSAISLPAPSFWNTDGTYKNIQTIKSSVYSTVGLDRDKEIIVYCGVGGYASTTWYVLSEMLGYKNVKIYDGSAQEWVKYYDMEM
ncbi:MAG: rhodanese-like domain-containing protein [Clostridiales bacterium]